MAFSANSLHAIHRYAATYSDITNAQTNGTCVVGQVVALSGTNRLFYGISATLYKEFASPTDTISVTDSSSVDLSYSNGAISAVVKRSADNANSLEQRADGLYVATPVIPADYVQSVTDTSTVDLTVAADALSAVVKVSSTAGNTVTVNADGLYVATPAADFVQSITDTSTVDLTVSADALSAVVKVSATAGNTVTVNADGLYVATPAADFVRSITDTTSIDLTVDSNGDLSGYVKLATSNNFLAHTGGGVSGVFAAASNSLNLYAQSGGLKGDVIVKPGSDNAISVTSTGLYARKLTVASGSTGLLAINTTTNEISLEKQASIEVIVDSVSVSIAEFVANTALLATASMGDYIYMPNAPNAQRGWVTKVATPTTVSDFIPVEYADYTQAEIRAMLSAGQGLVFNATTGVFSAKLSTDASNDITFGSDNGLYVDAASANVGIVKGGSTVNQTIQYTLNEIYSRFYAADNGLNMDGLTVKLGGALLADTTINGAFDLTIHNTKFDGTYVDVITGDVKFNASTQGLIMKDSNAAYWKMTVNTFGQWVGTPFTL